MVLKMLGNPEAAAWAGLWLFPTSLACAAVGSVGLIVPSRAVLIAVLVVTAIHVAVGFGMFPA